MDKINALIDTNVLLDHLAHREGFCQDAAVSFPWPPQGRLTGIIQRLRYSGNDTCRVCQQGKTTITAYQFFTKSHPPREVTLLVMHTLFLPLPPAFLQKSYKSFHFFV